MYIANNVYQLTELFSEKTLPWTRRATSRFQHHPAQQPAPLRSKNPPPVSQLFPRPSKNLYMTDQIQNPPRSNQRTSPWRPTGRKANSPSAVPDGNPCPSGLSGHFLSSDALWLSGTTPDAGVRIQAGIWMWLRCLGCLDDRWRNTMIWAMLRNTDDKRGSHWDSRVNASASYIHWMMKT